MILTSFGEKKINVIKEIRGITGLGLKEAKEFVESCPKPVKEGIPKDEAEELQKKLEEFNFKTNLAIEISKKNMNSLDLENLIKLIDDISQRKN